MKIGVSSYSFEKYRAATGCSYFEMCDIAKEIGFDGIEFTDLLVSEGVTVLALAEKIKKALKKEYKMSGKDALTIYNAKNREAYTRLLQERIQ